MAEAVPRERSRRASEGAPPPVEGLATQLMDAAIEALTERGVLAVPQSARGCRCRRRRTGRHLPPVAAPDRASYDVALQRETERPRGRH